MSFSVFCSEYILGFGLLVDVLRHQLGMWEIITDIFHKFVMFFRIKTQYSKSNYNTLIIK